MNNLPTIKEEHSQEMSQRDIEMLQMINKDISAIEQELKDDEEKDPELNEMKIQTLKAIELELQYRRKENEARKEHEKFLDKIDSQMVFDYRDHQRRQEPFKSLFAPPVVEKADELLTDKEKNDNKVPESLKEWIFRPEIA